MKSPIIFNHIPRSGGTTLRIILNRVYGIEKVFFIKSTDIGVSLDEFIAANIIDDSPNYKVISGHGAELFGDLYQNPFKITILREPISMFISQYHYLKSSPNSNFLEEVKALNSFEDYIDYAIQNGQDNMLCRMLSGSHQWLLNEEYAEMETEGESILESAKNTLQTYDAILDLANFDAGVYALSEVLAWRKIPIYRQSNRSKYSSSSISKNTMNKLQHLLRFDIELYNYFIENQLDMGMYINKRTIGYKAFAVRQSIISGISSFLRKTKS